VDLLEEVGQDLNGLKELLELLRQWQRVSSMPIIVAIVWEHMLPPLEG